MAVGAQQIRFRAAPGTCAAAMHARSPVPQLLAMALSAQTVRFVKGNKLSAGQVKTISIARVVTIQAPPMLLVVL
jgi:hypothetical protein